MIVFCSSLSAVVTAVAEALRCQFGAVVVAAAAALQQQLGGSWSVMAAYIIVLVVSFVE